MKSVVSERELAEGQESILTVNLNLQMAGEGAWGIRPEAAHRQVVLGYDELMEAGPAIQRAIEEMRGLAEQDKIDRDEAIERERQAWAEQEAANEEAIARQAEQVAKMAETAGMSSPPEDETGPDQDPA